MKTIPKHLVAVLPRVHSNSLASPRLYSSSSLSLFDSSPPPPSRPILSSTRLSIEGKPAEVEGSQNSQHHSHSHPPFSLALAQPQSSSSQTLEGQYALFPYSSLTHPCYPHPHAQQTSQEPHTHPRPKRQRLKYQLDVGAYGIPKRCRAVPSSRRHHSHKTEDVGLSVQIGEDAYFVRDNAMGVADGVGGWTKSSHSRPSSTPSALFARRLMHYCSAELDSVSSSDKSPVPRLHPPSRPHFSFTHHLRPRPPPAWKWSESSSLPASFTFHDVFTRDHNHHLPFSFSEDEYSTTAEYEDSDLEQDLEDSLEELSEGIDVLQILERAYDKTLKAHVVPESFQSSVNAVPSPTPTPTPGESKLLLEGSSTALLAVLDYPPRPSHASSSSTINPAPISPSSSSSASVSTSPSPAKTPHPKTTKLPSFSIPSPTANNLPHTASTKNKTTQTPLKASTATATAPSTPSTPASAVPEFTPVECELEECEGEYDAVIKIAHVGDCMGMLVRDEEIVWRSEEMWWDFNTPVQLGPSTQTTVTPRNSAMVITIPVKADDILILASDGLSDNLWDEDVLDEVVRFKKSFLSDSSLPPVNASTPDVPENDSGYSSIEEDSPPPPSEGPQLKRKTLAGMLSEALCSRARRVSERRVSLPSLTNPSVDVNEVPFARRAREAGKKFVGGKNDDISVVVAVISPRVGVK